MKKNKLKTLIISSSALLGLSILTPISTNVLADINTPNQVNKTPNTQKATDLNASNNNEEQTFIIPKYNNSSNDRSSNIYDNITIPNNNTNDDEYFSQLDKKLDTMTDEQIQQFIDEQVTQSKLENMYGESKIAGIGVVGTWVRLKAAWYAAGAIAKRKGYTCAGTLIQYSVLNKNYTEYSHGGGLFAKKIKASAAFKTAKRKHPKLITFSHGDLFLALHTVTAYYHHSKQHPFHIYDKYDFKLKSYRGTLHWINNWGYLSQNLKLLNPIKVNIYFK